MGTDWFVPVATSDTQPRDRRWLLPIRSRLWDCGEDGSGWCHQSVSNCAVCTGFFNYGATAPNCGGSPSPQPQPTPSPGPCSDENQNCGNWAASGQCETNP